MISKNEKKNLKIVTAKRGKRSLKKEKNQKIHIMNSYCVYINDIEQFRSVISQKFWRQKVLWKFNSIIDFLNWHFQCFQSFKSLFFSIRYFVVYETRFLKLRFFFKAFFVQITGLFKRMSLRDNKIFNFAD